MHQSRISVITWEFYYFTAYIIIFLAGRKAKETGANVFLWKKTFGRRRSSGFIDVVGAMSSFFLPPVLCIKSESTPFKPHIFFSRCFQLYVGRLKLYIVYTALDSFSVLISWLNFAHIGLPSCSLCTEDSAYSCPSLWERPALSFSDTRKSRLRCCCAAQRADKALRKSSIRFWETVGQRYKPHTSFEDSVYGGVTTRARPEASTCINVPTSSKLGPRKFFISRPCPVQQSVHVDSNQPKTSIIIIKCCSSFFKGGLVF